MYVIITSSKGKNMEWNKLACIGPLKRTWNKKIGVKVLFFRKYIFFICLRSVEEFKLECCSEKEYIYSHERAIDF